MYKLLGLLLICFVVVTHGQRYFLGNCPDVTLQEDFDVSRYMGKWYEIESYFASFSIFAQCVSADYTLDGERVIVNNTAYIPLYGYYTVVGDGIQVDPSSPAKLGVSFDMTPTAERVPNYLVISTDYDSYSIVWSCTQELFYNSQFAFILSRDRRGLSPETMDLIYRKLAENDIKRDRLMVSPQDNCDNKRGLLDLFRL